MRMSGSSVLPPLERACGQGVDEAGRARRTQGHRWPSRRRRPWSRNVEPCFDTHTKISPNGLLVLADVTKPLASAAKLEGLRHTVRGSFWRSRSETIFSTMRSTTFSTLDDRFDR